MWFNPNKYPYANTLQSLDKTQNEIIQLSIINLKQDWAKFREEFLSSHPAFSDNPLARELPVGKNVNNRKRYWGWAASNYPLPDARRAADFLKLVFLVLL